MKIITPLGISGSRHERKLKLSPKKLLDKRLLAMSKLWSRDKLKFYRLDNKSVIFVITEKVCTHMLLHLCQMIFK